MGKKNSSLTRVQPVFDYINNDIDRMNKFLMLFKRSNNIKSKMKCWYGCDEKAIPPSRELLVWCINNIEKLKKTEFEKIVNSNSKTDKKRSVE